jgi:tetratricopeptide (TPR) repeat protein
MSKRSTIWIIAVVLLGLLGGGAWRLWHLSRLERFAENRAAGEELAKKGQLLEAEVKLTEALKEAEEFGESDPRLDETLNQLAEVYVAQGKHHESESLYLRSLTIRVQQGGPSDPDVAQALHALGDAHLAQGNFDVAEGMYNQALHAWEQGPEPNGAGAAATHQALGDLYNLRGKLVESSNSYARALAILEKVLPPEDEAILSLQEHHAAVLRKRGMEDEAKALDTRIGAMRTKQAVAKAADENPDAPAGEAGEAAPMRDGAPAMEAGEPDEIEGAADTVSPPAAPIDDEPEPIEEPAAAAPPPGAQ